MGVFEDLGVMVDGLEDETAEEFGGEVEEIFRFDVLLTREQDIEIGVNIQELEVEGFPDFGEEYSMLAHTFAELITEHVGMYTEGLMMEVADLPELDVELTPEERAALADEDMLPDGEFHRGNDPDVLPAGPEHFLVHGHTFTVRIRRQRVKPGNQFPGTGLHLHVFTVPGLRI